LQAGGRRFDPDQLHISISSYEEYIFFIWSLIVLWVKQFFDNRKKKKERGCKREVASGWRETRRESYQGRVVDA
jgi:hypothetical protein